MHGFENGSMIHPGVASCSISSVRLSSLKRNVMSASSLASFTKVLMYYMYVMHSGIDYITL